MLNIFEDVASPSTLNFFFKIRMNHFLNQQYIPMTIHIRNQFKEIYGNLLQTLNTKTSNKIVLTNDIIFYPVDGLAPECQSQNLMTI